MIDIDKRLVIYGAGFEADKFIYENACRMGKQRFLSRFEYAIDRTKTGSSTDCRFIVLITPPILEIIIS